MAEASGGEHNAGDRVLLVAIITEPRALDGFLTGLVDLGLSATVLEAKGLMSLLRDEMPIFAGLTSMLPETTGTRVALSVASRKGAARALDFVEKEFRKNERPIALTLPIDQLAGLRR